jgi:hypothetical protein
MKLIEEVTGVTSDVSVMRAIEGVHRVMADGDTVGYVLEAGPVFVTLQGAVYNTSYEVGQSLDLDAAVRILVEI